jgi:hypothetical protein
MLIISERKVYKDRTPLNDHDTQRGNVHEYWRAMEESAD